ncbi:hypothetical protein RUND412_002315 [Rhizina undulata]
MKVAKIKFWGRNRLKNWKYIEETMPPKRQRVDDAGEGVSKRVTRSRGKVVETVVADSEEGTLKVKASGEKKETKGGKPKPKKEKKGKADVKKEEKKAEEDDGEERGIRYWLMKAEPESRIEKGKDVKFSIDDLAACTAPAPWDGVRNYAARNNITSMRPGDLAFFYHSNCKSPGIVGIMSISGSASIDATAFDPSEPYYDPKSSRDSPKWFLVHVSFVRKLSRPIGLHELKSYAGNELREMPLLKLGRLSVSGVPKECWDFILDLEGKE